MTLVRRSRERPHEIQLTSLAFHSLAFLSTLGEKHEGEVYFILLDSETHSALESERYPDESYSDCILRLSRKGDPSEILQPPIRRMSVTLEEAKHFGVIPVLRVTGRGKSRKAKTPDNEKWWVEVHPKMAQQIEYRRKQLKDELALIETTRKIDAKKARLVQD